MPNYFPSVTSWAIPQEVLRRSMEEMAVDGRAGDEGVALWLGRRKDGRADISHVVGLRGHGVHKGPAFLEIEPSLFNEVADLAITHQVSLVGQIHSHGVGWSTDLSMIDRTGGLLVPHYLSVVAPDYALRPETRIEDCGVHVFEPGRGYRRLSNEEIADRVKVIAGGAAPFLTAGQ